MEEENDTETKGAEEAMSTKQPMEEQQLAGRRPWQVHAVVSREDGQLVHAPAGRGGRGEGVHDVASGVD